MLYHWFCLVFYHPYLYVLETLCSSVLSVGSCHKQPSYTLAVVFFWKLIITIS